MQGMFGSLPEAESIQDQITLFLLDLTWKPVHNRV